MLGTKHFLATNSVELLFVGKWYTIPEVHSIRRLMSFLDYLTQNEVVTRNEVPIKDKALVNQVAAATDH